MSDDPKPIHCFKVYDLVVSDDTYIVFDETAAKAKYVVIKAANAAGYGRDQQYGLRDLFVGMRVRKLDRIKYDEKRHKVKHCYLETDAAVLY